jgi:hypothetical protein
MKGIPQIVIKNTAEKQFDGNVMSLYEYLYNGNSLEKNLIPYRHTFVACHKFSQLFYPPA